MPDRMNPWDYYTDFVYPNFWDFRGNRGDLRKAFNASVSAFQLADQFYFYCKRHDPKAISEWKTQQELLVHLKTMEPAFITVHSVASAYKHLYLAAAHYDTSSPGALRAVTMPRTGTSPPIGIGDFDHEGDPVEVIVRRKDGSSIVLYDCLSRVVDDMWPKILYPDQGGAPKRRDCSANEKRQSRVRAP